MSTSPKLYTGPSRIAILAQIQAFNNECSSDQQHAFLKLEYNFTPADNFQLSIHQSDFANHKASSTSLQRLCHELKSDLDSLLACPTHEDAENLNLQLIVHRCQALAQSINKLQEFVAKEKENKRLSDLAVENLSEKGKTAQATKDEASKVRPKGEMEKERIKKAGEIERYITQPKEKGETERENERRNNAKTLEVPKLLRSRSKSPRPDSAKPSTSSPNLSPRRVASPMPNHLLSLKPKTVTHPKTLHPILKKVKKDKKEDKAITFTGSTKPGSSSLPAGLELPHSHTNVSKHNHTGLRLEEYHYRSGSSSKLEEWKTVYSETEEEKQRKKRNEAAAKRAYEAALANAKELWYVRRDEVYNIVDFITTLLTNILTWKRIRYVKWARKILRSCDIVHMKLN